MAISCAVLLGVVIVGALAFAFVGTRLSSAGAGDCVQLQGTDAERRDCADASANYVVLGVESSTRDCVGVIGATAAVEAGTDKVLCLGVKGADVGKAVNGAKVGDCLLTEDDSAQRASCATGTRKVLEILRNKLRSNTGNDLEFACGSVECVDAAYAWSLESSKKSLVGTYDLIFCLGPEQR